MSLPRQPWLFRLDTPLAERLGPDFPARVPSRPGVYFFRDGHGDLLYIGQSSNLRQRLASYRHVTPDRHPRRTLRLVNRIARVDWRLCQSASEAEELERVLLLEYRPPFNRAGTWQGLPWWLEIESSEAALRFRIVRESSQPTSIGPLPSAFRYVFISLARCASRLAHPDRHLWEHPAGLFSPSPPLSWEWNLPDPAEWERLLRSFATGESTELMERLNALPASREQEDALWEEEMERLRRFRGDALADATAKSSKGCAK